MQPLWLAPRLRRPAFSWLPTICYLQPSAGNSRPMISGPLAICLSLPMRLTSMLWMLYSCAPVFLATRRSPLGSVVSGSEDNSRLWIRWGCGFVYVSRTLLPFIVIRPSCFSTYWSHQIQLGTDFCSIVVKRTRRRLLTSTSIKWSIKLSDERVGDSSLPPV